MIVPLFIDGLGYRVPDPFSPTLLLQPLYDDLSKFHVLKSSEFSSQASFFPKKSAWCFVDNENSLSNSLEFPCCLQNETTRISFFGENDEEKRGDCVIRLEI